MAAVAHRWQAVALDMDGTTLTSDGSLTPRTAEALRCALAAGIRVVIATGRPANALQRYLDILAMPEPLPAVCFNGACALRIHARTDEERAAGLTLGRSEVIFTKELSREATEQVLAVCSQCGWCASYTRPETGFVAPLGEEQERLLGHFEDLEGVRQQRIGKLEDLLARDELPLKIVAFVPNSPEECAERARAALPPGLVHIVAAEMHIEFLSPDVTKGYTLAAVCKETLGVPLEAVVAFGDNHNDKEMLQLVGEGVAMRNAKPAVKEIAARTCSWTNDEEGIAQELEAILASFQ